MMSRRRSARPRRLLLGLLALFLPFGCAGAAGQTDSNCTAQQCCTAEQCDDGVACTIDQCGTEGCSSTPDHSRCAAAEICDPNEGCQPPPFDHGPSPLFNDETLGDAVAPHLAPYFLTLDQIKALDLDQLGHAPAKPNSSDCGWLDKPCVEQVALGSLPGDHEVTVYKGDFVSGVYAAPTAQALVDFVGQPFSHFPLQPKAGLKGNFEALAEQIYPVDLNHSYELIIPANIDWSRANYGAVAVTQHKAPNPETIMAMQTKSRQIAVKYRLPVLHVLDLISFKRLTCTDRKTFPDCPANPDSKIDPLGYFSGNNLIRMTSVMFPVADLAGVPTTTKDYDYLQATFAMYAYARAYIGSNTFLKRMLERVYTHLGKGDPPADLADNIVTAGGSKDGGAVLYATDVDDRIVAAQPGGFDILDIAGAGGFVERFGTDWGRCGGETDWVYIPGPSQAVLPWYRLTEAGARFLDTWDLFNIIPEYDTSFDNGPEGLRDLFMVYRYSTHDLHYPLGSTLRFWWDSPGFDQLNHRQLVAINHDHGGAYEPAAEEGAWMELDGWDLMLTRIFDQREPVQVRIDAPELIDDTIVVSGVASSADAVGGIRLFVAQSLDRNFSLARGIELPDWSKEFPFSRLGNEGQMSKGPRGPEGSNYGGFSWTYVATTPSSQKPVNKSASVIADPWGDDHDEVVYLYAFPPEELPMSKDLERTGFFIRKIVGSEHLTSGSYGDKEVRFRYELPHDPKRASAILVGAWDTDQSGTASWAFSRYDIVNEQPGQAPKCD